MGAAAYVLAALSLAILPIWPVTYISYSSIGLEGFKASGFANWLVSSTGSRLGMNGLRNFLRMPFFQYVVIAGVVLGVVGVIFAIISKSEKKMTALYLSLIGCIVNFFFLVVLLCS